MTSMEKIVISFVFTQTLLLFSCNMQNTPCEYNIVPFHAKIVDMAKANDDGSGETLYTIYLEFDDSKLSKEKQTLNALTGHRINDAYFDRNKLQLGNIYRGVVSERISGNGCEERFVTFDVAFKDR
jgi:hypothetical protein